MSSKTPKRTKLEEEKAEEKEEEEVIATSSSQTLEKLLSSLTPCLIKKTKCEKEKSLYEQILRNNDQVLKDQKKKYNLGNSKEFNCAFKAADHLLEREYGDTSLFVEPNSHNRTIFIPPLFPSIQFNKKKTSTPILNYEIEYELNRSLKNLEDNKPEHWFTQELKHFVDKVNEEKGLIKKSFDDWLCNVKTCYLMSRELKTTDFSDLSLVETTCQIFLFNMKCIEELKSKSPNSTLLRILEEKSKDLGKKKVKNLTKKFPPKDFPFLAYLFEFDLSEMGEEVDHWLFDQITLSCKHLKDIVVLCNTQFNAEVINKDKQSEFDILMFCWPKKLIIGIECKRSLNEKAFEQLKNYQLLLMERLGDQLEDGWKFWPVVCVKEKEIRIEIKDQHYISMDTDIKEWLGGVLEQTLTSRDQDTIERSKEQVKNVLKIIIFAVHSGKNNNPPIIETNWVDYVRQAIDNCSSSSSIMFYSKNQLYALGTKDRYMKLLINGGFGTGKTVLLHDKAKLLSTDKEYEGKILYVCLSKPIESFQSLLYHRSKEELDKDKNKDKDKDNDKDKDKGINVLEYKADELKKDKKEDPEKIKKRYEKLEEFIKTKEIKALFLDEWDIDIKLTEEISKLVSILWIAPSASSQRNLKSNKQTVDGFDVLDLTFNLRNSKEIVKETKDVADKDEQYCFKEFLTATPPNFPGGCEPKHVSTLVDAIKEARKLTKEGGILINVDLIDIDDKLKKFLDDKKEEFKRYYFQKNDFEKTGTINTNPYKFLWEGNILFTDNSHVKGFDWPTVICIQQSQEEREKHHKCNYFLRCTTNLIIVKK